MKTRTRRRSGRWMFAGVALAISCGGTVAVRPPVVTLSARAPERPAPAFLAWAHARPTYTVAELAYLNERFDIGRQVARDHAPLLAPAVFATALLARTDGSPASGTVRFDQEKGQVLIHAHLSGLLPGEHGFTINDAEGCASPGALPAGHWNPTHSKHGAIGSSMRHVGDFGNLSVDAAGNVDFAVVTDSFRVSGDESVVGKTVVIHARRDDGKSQPSGNSGAVIACGVVLRSGLRVAAAK